MASPDCATWFGRRDRTLLLVMLQTGLRVSETIGLRVCDAHLGTGAHVRCTGKGRKERATPLRSDSREALRRWIDEHGGGPNDPLVHDHAGNAAEPGCRGTHRAQIHSRRCANVPHVGEQARHAARSEAQRRHGASAQWRGPHRHRPLAGTRTCGNHPDVRPRGHHVEGARSGANPSRGRRRSAVPTNGRTARLPGGAVDYADTLCRRRQSGLWAEPAARHNPNLGIVTVMPLSA